MKVGRAYRFGAVIRMTVLVAVASLAGSCDKTLGPQNPEWIELGGDRPVVFSSNVVVQETKAALPSGTHFGVFAYYTGTSNWNSVKGNTTSNFMYNQEVVFDGSSYTYAPVKYWPNNTGDKVTFLAYSPYSATPVLRKIGANIEYTNTTKNLPDIGFTVTDGQTDFMISDLKSNQTKPALDAPVELVFRHMLSKITFNVKKVDAAVPEKYTVRLKDIRLEGLYMNAIHRNAGWADWSGLRRDIQVYTAPSESDLTLTTSFQPVASVIPLPQDLDNEAAKLRVEYTIYADGMITTRTTVCEVRLSDVFTSAWAQNAHYTVNITITPDDPIEFTVSWTDWGDAYNYHITS